ncbi:unnamed protein product [Rotaria sordida]|uniref:Uncharacterized protein n=1 Tax=Rotaria sordida TaxID=392033 RepID=A0A819X6K5_9BILA|nr:unnamed protein product [Rotaria sordida]
MEFVHTKIQTINTKRNNNSILFHDDEDLNIFLSSMKKKALLTCIDLLYADENLQQSSSQLLFYDDLLNGMMFLGLPDEYFIKILILLLNAQFSTERACRSFNIIRARQATLYVYDGINQTIIERIPNPDCEQIGYQLRLSRENLILIPTKDLLHLKEFDSNLFLLSSIKIYSKILQKLFDRALFAKLLNNDVNIVSSDLHVLACSDDNDAYSTCTSLLQPMPAIILVLGSTSCEYAFVWKLLQRQNFYILISPDYVDTKQIDLVVSLNKTYYFEEFEACLYERGLHYFECSIDTLALSVNQLNTKRFMSKHKIPTLDWIHYLNEEDLGKFLNKYPNKEQWIIRATNGNSLIKCKT